MNKTLGIVVIALVAVIMGMSAMAPAMAVGPPADPRAGNNPPEISCEELEALLESLPPAAQKAKEKILAKAGC